MDKGEFNRLLDRFRTGTISLKEKEKLDDWFASFDVLDDYTDGMRTEEQNDLSKKMLLTIQKEIRAEEVKSKHRSNQFRRAVSVVTLVLAVVFLSILYYPGVDRVQYQTGNGEMIHLQLPDGSKVTLNGNTLLEFQLDWSGNFRRKVRLQGEAYFEIAHTESNDKFLVDQGNGMRVEVHGTEFNVSSRDDKQRVVLKSGSVQLFWDKNKLWTTDSFLMEPGQVAQFQNKEQEYTVFTPDNPEKYYSWKDGKLLLDQTRLEDILSIIKETHNVNILVGDSLSNEKIASGTLPLSENAQELSENIAALFELEVEIVGMRIRLK